MHVAVVTDSTSDLSSAEAESLGIRVVPLSVAFGERGGFSRISMSDEEFYGALGEAGPLPTTSQPVPAWFEEAWADAADEGADAVVSVHVSGELSGTVARARALAPAAPLPVTVVDSRQVSGGLALQVLAAHRAAAGGASVDAVVDAVGLVRDTTRTLLVVDTLEYLRRGGRLSGAQAAIGGVLRVRPLLTVRDGRIEVLERTRTWSVARGRLVELVEAHADGRPVRVVVAHALAPDRAAELRAAVRERVEVVDDREVVIGPVVGTHAGPRAVGVAVTPA